MFSVYKRIAEPQNVVFVVGIVVVVELGGSSVSGHALKNRKKKRHHLKNGNLHHALIEIRRFIFDDLDRDDLVRLHILTLDDLPKGPLSEDVEDQVPAIQRVKQPQVNETGGRAQTCGHLHSPASCSRRGCNRSRRCRTHHCGRACSAL
jgi:hypothetical protein